MAMQGNLSQTPVSKISVSSGGFPDASVSLSFVFVSVLFDQFSTSLLLPGAPGRYDKFTGFLDTSAPASLFLLLLVSVSPSLIRAIGFVVNFNVLFREILLSMESSLVLFS